jgi:two-component system cell cycle response regulator
MLIVTLGIENLGLDCMQPDSIMDSPSKPRVLIADDSRIVRATLIKHIQGMFDFREALDGEQAWETLLIDPTIRVVITDLTMPKLDGYGLLTRIRTSEISRIRSLPVVVVSGSDESEERERAMAAGATDLITKGIATAQLLSRLDILSKLANTQRDFEKSLEVLIRNTSPSAALELASPRTLQEQAERMLGQATQQGKNFFILHICVGVKHLGLAGSASSAPASVVNSIGQLLQKTVRQTDCLAKTGEAEFTLATGTVTFESAHNFAQRLCNVIGQVSLVKDDQMVFVASCGIVAMSEQGIDATTVPTSLAAMREVAHRRAVYGLNHAINGVIGFEEEKSFKEGRNPDDASQASLAALHDAVQKNTLLDIVIPLHNSSGPNNDAPPPDLPTLLQWMKEGKQDQVMRHIGKLSVELQPLVDLMLRQSKH